MAQMDEPIRYVGNEIADIEFHHGRLKPVVGVQSYQVLRANRSHPEWAEGYGWTYNHAPMLAYWHNTFYLEYLSTVAEEHIPPGQTLLTTSKDGISWEKPTVVFPPYVVPDGVYVPPEGYELPKGSFAVMHQRMGFYVAPDGRLLVLGFYGICPIKIGAHERPAPFDTNGIGRVVREIYPDNTFGPIYFIRYNRHAGWNETNTRYPFYKQSPDKGFVAACDALLSNKLMTQQWNEEAGDADEIITLKGGYKAFCFYHLPDGRVVGLWKWAKAAISDDEGNTWSPVVDVPSLVMANAKVWGQRTSDGRYALVYNPSPSSKHRWPLALVTSDDGINFDNLCLVNGEVPPRRYCGSHKDYGLNYVRGIVEGNGTPPDGDMWVVYSMNKEDIWISHIPVPIRWKVDHPVYDTFNDMKAGGQIKDWNIYSPQWAPVSVVEFPSKEDKSLELKDSDPYDYAKAERIFPESQQVTIKFRVLPKQCDAGQLFVEVADDKGHLPARLLFDADGYIKVKNRGAWTVVAKYESDHWYDMVMDVDTLHHSFIVSVTDVTEGELLLFKGKEIFSENAMSVERLIFRTGPVNEKPSLEDNPDEEWDDLPNSEEPLTPAVFYINYVLTQHHDGLI